MTTRAGRAGDWDGRSYHRVARPHASWGMGVLDRARLQGNERVLDAGCGSGRVTAQLLERLPRGHVVAADISPSMLDQAHQTLAPFADRVSFVQADLTSIDQVLPLLEAPVDVVFSTAVFHWIADHERLFAALYRVLRPGGRLVAQCGGGPNLRRFMQATDAVAARPAYRDLLHGHDLWRFYAGPDDTHSRLRAAGFSETHPQTQTETQTQAQPRAMAWLEDSPQTFPSAAALAEYARAVVLTNHVNVLPEPVREAFVVDVVDEIHAREGAYMLDYVRLNIDAARA